MFRIDVEKYESSIEFVGNILEWYNFALFMPFLHILSREFFPLENVVHREALSFLALSAGLFMRPFGAAILGPIGDKFGRRRAISISIILMAIPTMCIGLLPNYNQIGVLAPVLLIILRAMQGISLGGEYTAAMVHLVERAPQNKQGFYGSLSDAGSQIGVLLGGQSLVFLYSFFSREEICSFAWRIPFLFAIALIPFAFLVPNNFSTSKNKSSESIFKSLKTYRKEVVCTVSITAFSAVGFYTLLTFLPYYLVSSDVLSLKEAAICSVYSTLAMIIFILIGGYFSDLYSKKFFMIFGITGVSVTICLMFLFRTTSFDQWLALQLLYGVFLGLYYSSRAAFFSSAFPPHVRCTAVSISLSLAQAVFGGLTPITMNHITKISHFLSVIPIIFISICAVYALIVHKENKLNTNVYR
ncbi:MAG: MFS transporter [Holosporaceae bacterium]|jgi:MHS family proline/betaine transporter-like MFS transporter|nr:MFS transporter [Holosporaceae bacterium]